MRVDSREQTGLFKTQLMKICTKCGKGDTEVPFVIGRNVCIVCRDIYNKEWRENNPEKIRKSRKKWRENNPEKIRKSLNKWAVNNPEKIRKLKMKWKKNNPEKIRKSTKKYVENHPEKVSERNRKYYEKHSEKERDRRRKYSENNLEKKKDQQRKYREKFSDSINKWSREHKQMDRLLLRDPYIKSLICKIMKLKCNELNDDLVEAYREILKVKKLLTKKHKDHGNEQKYTTA